MARKKQQLINYHTSGVTNMPQVEDVALGEIVVRHATDKPELLIKKDNNEFATFVDSGKVQSMITTSSTDLQGQITAISDNLRDNYATSASTVAAISAVEGKIESLSGSVSAFSATVVNTYATSADTESAIATAKSEAVSSGKGYTDGQISAVTSAYTKADNDLDARIDKLEAISADTQSAVQNVVVDNANANKITATKTVEDNVVTLNFDNMVVDCGEF